MGWTHEQNAFLSFTWHVPAPLEVFTRESETSVPLFNYGSCLLRDLRNVGVHLKAWDSLEGD